VLPRRGDSIMFEICPTAGIGPAIFGMSRDEVRAVLGRPDKTEVVRHSDDSTEEGWEYLLAGLDLTFCDDEEWRLSAIRLHRNTGILRGEQIIGISEAELHDACRRLGYSLALQLEILESDGHLQEWRDKEAILSFWVEDSHVASITMMPLHDPAGRPLWPTRGSS
jgi:hypothetical protein